MRELFWLSLPEMKVLKLCRCVCVSQCFYPPRHALLGDTYKHLQFAWEEEFENASGAQVVKLSVIVSDAIEAAE